MKHARRIAVVIGWALIAPLAINVVVRIALHDRVWLSIVLNTFTPYVYLPAYLALAFGVWQKKRPLIGVSAIVAIAHLVWVFGPLTRSEPAPAVKEGTRPLRLFSANVAYWNNETEWITSEILASDADVVFVHELSKQWENAFASDAFREKYPNRIEEVREEDGSGIYARIPLLEKDFLETGVMPVARATVQIQGTSVRLYAVHPPPPSRAGLVESWNRALEAVLVAVKRETLPVVLAGDFNMTQHAAWYGRLREAGFRAAHDACGRPLATTWPNGSRNFPPVRLDHVFLPPALGCVRVSEGAGKESDHRPVIADVTLK